MKTVSAPLLSALRQMKIDPVIRLITGATTFDQSRILFYDVHEFGRLGRADLIVELNNNDGALDALTGLRPRHEITTSEGAVVAGVETVIVRHKWIVIEAKPSSFRQYPVTLRITARNYWEKFNLAPEESTVWTRQTIGVIAAALATLAGVTASVDASDLWSHVLDEWRAPSNFPLQPVIGDLIGDGQRSQARAYGRFETTGVWTLIGLEDGPASVIDLGSANETRIDDARFTYNPTATRVQINSAYASLAGHLDALETEIGAAQRLVVNARALVAGKASAELTDRLVQELIEQSEQYRRGVLTISPDLRLQLWDPVALFGVASETDDTWRVTDIRFIYQPGKITHTIEVRRAVDALTYLPIIGGWYVGDDVVFDNFDTYGGEAIAQSGSSGLKWLLLALEGDILLGLNYIYVDYAYSPVLDLTSEGRFTAADFICVRIGPINDQDQYTIVFVSAAGTATYTTAEQVAGDYIFLAVKRSDFTLAGTFDWSAVTTIRVGGRNQYGLAVWDPHIDDVRLVKADPADSTTFNDTGEAWSFDDGIWHIYDDVPDIPFALGQIDTGSPGTRVTALRVAPAYSSGNHFAAGVYLREAGAVGLLAFAADDDNCYEIKIDSVADTVSLLKWVDGSSSVLGSVAYTITPEVRHTLGLVRDAGYLRVFISADDSPVFLAANLVLYVADDTYLSGQIGVVSYGVNSRFFRVRAGAAEHAITAEYAFNAAALGDLPAERYDPTTELDARYLHQVASGDHRTGPLDILADDANALCVKMAAGAPVFTVNTVATPIGAVARSVLVAAQYQGDGLNIIGTGTNSAGLTVGTDIEEQYGGLGYALVANDYCVGAAAKDVVLYNFNTGAGVGAILFATGTSPSEKARLTNAGVLRVKIAGAAGIAIDPNAATGDYTLSLSPVNLTGNRRVMLQDANGTLAYLTDTTPIGKALTRGSIYRGSAAGVVEALALGGVTGSALVRDATDVLWSASAAALVGVANVFTLSNIFSSSSDAGYIALGAIPASAGSIRLPYGSKMAFRNTANDGDVTVFSVLSGDTLRIGRDNASPTSIYGGANIDLYYPSDTGTISIRLGASTSTQFISINQAKLNASGYYLLAYVNSAVITDPVFGIYGNGRDHVFIGALDTTSAQTCTIKPFADRVALRVTGFATQTATRTLVNLIRNDTNVNVIAPVITATVNTTAAGGGSTGLGGSFALNLESSTTADQLAAAINWSWGLNSSGGGAHTHAGRTSTLAFQTVDNAGALADRIILYGVAMAFYGGTPVARAAALTTQLTTITYTAPGTPDYALQDLIDVAGDGSQGFSFATKDEGNSALAVIANLQTRVAELEARLGSATGVNLFA